MNSVNKLRVQIVFLGGCNTGKTYFLSRFIYRHQDPQTKSTMGVDALTARIRPDSKQYPLIMFDTSGNPIFDSIVTHFHIINHVFFVVFYDVTQESCIQQISKYLQMIEQNCKERRKVRILLLGNKTDLIQSTGIDFREKVKEEFQDRPDTTIDSTSVKMDFNRAMKIFQDFIMKCFGQKYLQAIIADMSTFFESLNLNPNVQWFKDIQQQQKIQKRLLEHIEKDSNDEQIMALGLAIQLLRKFKDQQRLQILQTKIECHEAYKTIEAKYKEAARQVAELQQDKVLLSQNLKQSLRKLAMLDEAYSRLEESNRTLSNAQQHLIYQNQSNKLLLSKLEQELAQSNNLLEEANHKLAENRQLQLSLVQSNNKLEEAKLKIEQIERRLTSTTDALVLAHKKIDLYKQNQLRIMQEMKQKTEALAKVTKEAGQHLTLLMQTKTKYIQQYLKKQGSKSSENEQRIKSTLASIKEDYQRGLAQLRQQLIAYQYWIIEADRLLENISDSIDQSPYRYRFEQFRRVAQRINDNIQEAMNLWDDSSHKQQLVSFVIEEDIKTVQEREGERKRTRKLFQAKVQQYQEILEDFLPHSFRLS